MLREIPLLFLSWLRASSQTETTFPLGILSQFTSIVLRIMNYNQKLILVHHQHIILLSQLSFIFEFQQGINLAICPSVLLDELVSKSIGDEDFSSSEGKYTNIIRSDSTLLPLYGSSGTRSEISQVNSVESTAFLEQ
jgi:hypothetical protein